MRNLTGQGLKGSKRKRTKRRPSSRVGGFDRVANWIVENAVAMIVIGFFLLVFSHHREETKELTYALLKILITLFRITINVIITTIKYLMGIQL